MKLLKIWWPVAVQIIQIPIVITIFKTVSDRQIAGLVAGSMFALVAILLMDHFYKKYGVKSPSLYFLMAHLFLITIPMLMFRLAYWGTPFDELSILGISGPSFHAFSERFYTLVILCSIYEIRKSNKQA